MIEIGKVSDIMMIALAFAMIICVFWPKQPEGWSMQRWKIFLTLMGCTMAFQLVRVCISEYIEEPWVDKMVIFAVLCRTFEYCASQYGERMRKQNKNKKNLE